MNTKKQQSYTNHKTQGLNLPQEVLEVTVKEIRTLTAYTCY